MKAARPQQLDASWPSSSVARLSRASSASAPTATLQALHKPKKTLRKYHKIPTPMNLSYPACRKRLAVKIIRVSRMALTVSGFGKYGSSTPVPSFMPSPCLSQQAAENEHRQKSASHTYRNPPQL